MDVTSPLRITLVTESFDPGLTGTAGTVRRVADHLVEAGHQVRIIAGGSGPAQYLSVGVERFGSPRRNHKIHQAMLAFGPDLLHAFTPGTVGTKALRQANRLGIPTMVTETSARAAFAPPAWRANVADRAGRLTVTATWLRDRLDTAGVDAQLWAPGVETSLFHPGQGSQDLRATWTDGDLTQVVVGYVGSLRKRHGVRHLTEVARLPGTRLVVVGDGPQRAWLRSRLPASVRFTGPLKPRETAVAIASLDLLIHPSTRATCAHAIREAAACGVPVVAPREGGALDVVEHLQTGLLYEPSIPGQLADAVSAVVADPRRQLLGDYGRELIARRTWREAVDELVTDHYEPLRSALVREVA